MSSVLLEVTSGRSLPGSSRSSSTTGRCAAAAFKVDASAPQVLTISPSTPAATSRSMASASRWGSFPLVDVMSDSPRSAPRADSASSIAPEKGLRMSARMTPTVLVRSVRRLRAALLGR